MLPNLDQQSNQALKEFLERREQGDFDGLSVKFVQVISNSSSEIVAKECIYEADRIFMSLDGRVCFDDSSHTTIYTTSLYSFTLFRLIRPDALYFEEQGGKIKVTITFLNKALFEYGPAPLDLRLRMPPDR